MRGRTLQLVASLGLLTLVAAWQVWDYWEARRLHAAILQIQARGEPVNAFEAMRQDAPKGAEGSGRFYAAADALLLIPDGTTQRLELLRRNLEASGRASAEERNHLGEFLRLNGPALELIARARELPFQGLPRDPGYDPRSSPRGPHVVVPRLASVLSAQALQLTLHGDGDGAARAVSAILRLLAGLSVEQSMFALGLHQRVLSRAVQDLVLILERTRPRDSPLAELQAALRSTDRAGASAPG